MKNGTILECDGSSFTVIKQLGQGGAGTVCAVRSSADDKTYALKQIKKDKRFERNERFRQEIAFGMGAKNDHVVKIHWQRECKDSFLYTMDLYPKTLRNIIDDESDYRVLLEYVYQLFDGLAYVHEQDVVHRDIKPENILVDDENQRLVLADFGIAHFKDSSVTRTGELLANRNYQAPEQMAKRPVRDVGKPADIFALGLIMTEVFTKQNARGARHKQVGEIHPFLSELDLLVEQMMLQDATQRITIQASRDRLNLIRNRIEASIEEIQEDLRPRTRNIPEVDLILERAGSDLLSAKHLFEQTSGTELCRYNSNYHCEISYCVTDDLYNLCVQSQLYTICKKKFEYEANSDWSDSDLDMVSSERKTDLLMEFESIQRQYPLTRNSRWAMLLRMAVHYFRFCKDYHCEEIIERARKEFSASDEKCNGSVYENLVNAPILWIVKNVREYLNTDVFEMYSQNRQKIEFERQVIVNWEETDLEDSHRKDLGSNLLESSLDEVETIAYTLEVLKTRWDVSFADQGDGTYAIYFNSCSEYWQFRDYALEVAEQNYIFEGDVLDLLRTDDIYDDVVALTWRTTFDIPNTLAKILDLREI